MSCSCCKRKAAGGLPDGSAEMLRHQSWQTAFKTQMLFTSHIRKEHNFIKGNRDVSLVTPPKSSMEVEDHYHTRRMLYSILQEAWLPHVVPLCLGFALISGSIGTYVCSVLYTGPHTSGHDGLVAWTQTATSKLLSDYKWLPTFMLGGHIAFYVQRWRQFIFAAWSVEGRFKDIAIILNMSVLDGNNPLTRSLMFKLYRFCVLAMALQYRKVIPNLRKAGHPEDPDGPFLDQLEVLGLLTPEERDVLAPATSRMRDCVLAWIAREVQLAGPSGTNLMHAGNYIVIMDKLTELRGKMMYFHGNTWYPHPNLSAAFMTMLIDGFCFLMMFLYPFIQLAEPNEAVTCCQPVTILTVFCMTLCFMGAESLISSLAQPFDVRQGRTCIDSFNIDTLIAGTEQTLFATLRSSFDDADRVAGVASMGATEL